MALAKLVGLNYIFKNNDQIGFDNVTEDGGVKNLSYSNGAAYADLDNDSDLLKQLFLKTACWKIRAMENLLSGRYLQHHSNPALMELLQQTMTKMVIQACLLTAILIQAK